MEKEILLCSLSALGVLLLAIIVRLVKGPESNDRIVALNASSSIIVAALCLFSCYFAADYLLDVALIYAILGFTANSLLLRMMIAKKAKKDVEK